MHLKLYKNQITIVAILVEKEIVELSLYSFLLSKGEHQFLGVIPAGVG